MADETAAATAEAAEKPAAQCVACNPPKEASQMVLSSTLGCCGIDAITNMPYGNKVKISRYVAINRAPWNEYQTFDFNGESVKELIDQSRTGKQTVGLNPGYKRGLILASTSSDQLQAEKALAEAGFVMIHEFENPAHAPYLRIKVWAYSLTEKSTPLVAVEPLPPKGSRRKKPTKPGEAEAVEAPVEEIPEKPVKQAKSRKEKTDVL